MINKLAVLVCIASLVSLVGFAQHTAEAKVLHQQELLPVPTPIILNAVFGGKPTLFSLDTGAGCNVCDPSLVPLLGPFLGDLDLKTIGPSPISTKMYRGPELKVAGFSLADVPIGVVDLHGFRLGTGINVRGILGSEVLKQSIVSLDFDARRLMVMDELPAIPPNMIETHLILKNAPPLPEFTVLIEGAEVTFMIDTGFTGTILLAEDTFAKFAAVGIIEKDSIPKATTLMAQGKEIVDPTGRFLRGRLLGRPLQGTACGSGRSNIVGLAFLVNFNLIIDYKKERLYYKLRDAMPPLHINGMLGMAVVYEGGLGVVHVLKSGGRAEKAGIRAGDRLVGLGDIERGKFSFGAVYDLCLRHAGKTVSVKLLRAGKEVPAVAELTIGEKQFLIPPAAFGK